jgi:endonuclease/exonuclease/phosphatase family metal-dependent hydrolase
MITHNLHHAHKRTLVLLCALFLSAASYAQTNKSKKITVLSYNIHHGNPPSRAKEGYIDLKAIAKVIKKSKAGLVALQEVDVNTERSGKGINQAQALAEMIGMRYYFAKTIDFQGGDYGIALLSAYPIIESSFYRLPMEEESKGEPRGVAVITVKLPGGEKLKVASTHLDLKVENKALQSVALKRIFENEGLPLILAGDFNALPDSEVIRELDQEFRRTCTENCGFTIPVVEPNRTIDYIMYRKPEQFQLISHQVIDEPYASDHLPVRAELKLNMSKP